MTSYTPKTWADHLLGLLGDPVTPGAETAIVAWEAAEGGHWKNTAFGNPLNTTQPEAADAQGGKSQPMNSVGVQSFSSWDQGFAATVATLRSGNGRYAGILAGLKSGDAAATAQAVVSSPWGTHKISLGNGATYTPGVAAATPAGFTADPAAFTIHLPGTPWDVNIPTPSDFTGAAGKAVAAVGSDVGTAIARFTILGVLLAGAVGLVVIGVIRASGAQQAAQAQAAKAEQLAPLAAAL